MAKSRVVAALESLEAEIAAARITADDIGPPANAVATITSQEIVESNGRFLIIIANLGIQDAWMSVGTDAIAESGIALPQGGNPERFLIPEGSNLNIITKMATTNVSWQLFRQSTS